MDASAVVYGGCRDLPSPDGIKVQACKSAMVSIAKGTFALKSPGDTFVTLPIKLQGPDPLACHSDNAKAPVDITFVPMPTLATVVPDILCIAEGDRTFTATGTGFLVVDGKLPTVRIGIFAWVPRAPHRHRVRGHPSIRGRRVSSPGSGP